MGLVETRGIYAITDCENHDQTTLLEKTEQLLQGGIALLQYRDKKNNAEDKFYLAGELRALCAKYNVPLIINDDVELAKKVSADGIHLGQDDCDINNARQLLGGVIIGISCYYDFTNAKRAFESGADYIAYGAFYPSTTKPDAVTAKPDILLKTKNALSIPVVAIGGISINNGKVLLDSGADFLAVCRGLYKPVNTAAAIKQYKTLFNDIQ